MQGLMERWSMLTAGGSFASVDFGVELGARVTGVELPAMSPPRRSRAQELRARDAGVETC